jgi:glucan biosynthesis protein C
VNRTVVVERFHALDANRAFALLLGVVFHLAWGFIPSNQGTPITDVSSSIGFDYFFFTAHIFRMQVFFLIAGFFARMMYYRLGAAAFSKNRLARIAVPFVIGWLILAPLIILTWVWGANRSGQNLSEVPLINVMFGMAMGYIVIPRSMGGLFSLGHLWFLYYLLWLYAVTLGVRTLLIRLIPDGAGLKKRIDSIVHKCVKSLWSVLGLGLATGLLLWRMNGWNGVDTPVREYQPSVPVLLIYGLFFVSVGCCLDKPICCKHSFRDGDGNWALAWDCRLFCSRSMTAAGTYSGLG